MYLFSTRRRWASVHQYTNSYPRPPCLVQRGKGPTIPKSVCQVQRSWWGDLYDLTLSRGGIKNVLAPSIRSGFWWGFFFLCRQAGMPCVVVDDRAWDWLCSAMGKSWIKRAPFFVGNVYICWQMPPGEFMCMRWWSYGPSIMHSTCPLSLLFPQYLYNSIQRRHYDIFSPWIEVTNVMYTCIQICRILHDDNFTYLYIYTCNRCYKKIAYFLS